MSLTVDTLTVYRGERCILDGLSFSAAPGQAVLLTGANGAGKTTLLKSIAGLIAPAKGSIRLARQSIGDETEADVGAQCHLVGHSNGVKATLSVIENAKFWAAYLGGSREAAHSALDAFGLGELATVRTGFLSAGQKRRLGLARLLLATRPVWLLDEPAVSLDTASRALLADVVNRHLAEGGYVVAATHQDLDLKPSRTVRLGEEDAALATDAGSAGP